MARDIGAGYVFVTERTLARMSRADVDKLSFELERSLRDLRGASTTALEANELQKRNRTMLKLNGARGILRAHLMKRKGL